VVVSKISGNPLKKISSYDFEGRALAMEIGQTVLVRDERQLCEGLEVPMFFYFFLFRHSGNKKICTSSKSLSALTNAGLETLYTRKDEYIGILELAESIIPKNYPNTYEYIMKRKGSPCKIKNVLQYSFYAISEDSGLIEINDDRCRIPREVRRTRIVPDVLVRSVA